MNDVNVAAERMLNSLSKKDFEGVLDVITEYDSQRFLDVCKEIDKKDENFCCNFSVFCDEKLREIDGAFDELQKLVKDNRFSLETQLEINSTISIYSLKKAKIIADCKSMMAAAWIMIKNN